MTHVRRRPMPVAVVDSVRITEAVPDQVVLCKKWFGKTPVHISGTPLYVCFTLITPEKATEILSHNFDGNRRLHGKRRRFATDMRSGHWLINHQGIALDSDGVLYDGQNRLSACIDAGVPFETLVFFGVHHAGVHSIDSGKSRSLEDAAKIVGIDGFAMQSAALLRSMLAGPCGAKASLTTLGNEDFFALFEILSEAITFTLKEAFTHQAPGLTHSGVKGAVASAYYHESIDDLLKFVHSLLSGEYDSKQKFAVIALRNFLLRNGRTSGGEPRRQELFQKTQNAIWHYCRNSVLEKSVATRQILYPLPEKCSAIIASTSSGDPE